MANYAEKPQMGFIEACSTACKKIVTFKGRARRSEFWWAVLGIFHHQPHHDSCRLYGNSGCHHLQPRQPCHYHFILVTDFPPSA